MSGESPVAVILVAGEGTRMKPFTDAQPKCFAEVGGVRILDNALDALVRHGCRRARIVVGHLEHVVRAGIGDCRGPLAIEYVSNPRFHVTNSMYSLWLGLEGLREPCLVLEGDVFFEHGILELPGSAAVTWYADSSDRGFDGAFLETDDTARARALTILRNPADRRPGMAKSIGILRCSAAGGAQLGEWMRVGVEAGRERDYYDLIVRDHMAESVIRVVDVAGRKWYEIDSLEDLGKAREYFAGRAT